MKSLLVYSLTVLGISSASATAAMAQITPAALSADSTPPSPGYERIPGGWIHPSCIHEVAEGARMDNSDSGTLVRDAHGHHLKTLPSCNYKFVPTSGKTSEPAQKSKVPGPLPDINGWTEWSIRGTDANHWYTQMDNWLAVPNAPTSRGSQVLYIFSSFENSCGIVQPVLQWGRTTFGGGSYWTMSNWFINHCTNTITHSPMRRVNAGDWVRLSLSSNSCYEGRCNWTVSYTPPSGTTSSNSYGSIGVVREADRAVLEVYSLTSCSQLPSSNILFWNTWLYQGNWSDWNAREEVGGGGFNGGFRTGTSPSCNWNVWNDGRDTYLQYN